MTLRARMRLGAVAIGLLSATACVEPFGSEKRGDALFDAVLDAMENGHVRRDSIDWQDLRAEARLLMLDEAEYSGAYPAISRAIYLLGDNHTWFQRPDRSFISVTRTISCVAPTVAAPAALPADIGYVRVRSFGGSADAAQAYMNEIRTQMELRDNPDIVGWVVDLRGNGGGNMWPMVTALHPFLQGTVGFFYPPDGGELPWNLSGATSFIGASPASVMNTGVYTPLGSTAKVAVLTDARVASSGEATAIAFRGRPNTRSFGTATCGVSTAIQALPMPGGHTLGLTGAWMADRNGVIYPSGVIPDEVIAGVDEPLARAIEWLR